MQAVLTDVPARILMRATVLATPCWNWTGARQSAGYGSVGVDGQTVLVHRYVYESTVGPIPPDATVDHLCSNKICFNPEHLRIVSRGENSARYYAGITHCPAGHPYDSMNTKFSKRGTRSCRTCYNAARRKLHPKWEAAV